MTVNVKKLQAQINKQAKNVGLLKSAEYVVNQGKDDEVRYPVEIIPTGFQQSRVNGDFIKHDDLQVVITCDQFDFEPVAGQSISYKDKLYTVTPIEPDPLEIVYTFRARR